MLFHIGPLEIGAQIIRPEIIQKAKNAALGCGLAVALPVLNQ